MDVFDVEADVHAGALQRRATQCSNWRANGALQIGSVHGGGAKWAESQQVYRDTFIGMHEEVPAGAVRWWT